MTAAVQPGASLDCDVLVVGGGINGTGIARDLAGRGLKVILCEQDDLASHTSSASTKLIHGGLRYLEQYEFGLVRKALIEREVLLRAAPHIIRPLRFVMPHDRGQRPAWLIRAGMFLYDHLARRELLPGSETVRLAHHPAGRPLKPGFTCGFVYSDGWVDDARLVVLNAIGAAHEGARILTRTTCESAVRQADCWSATLRQASGAAIAVTARCLVNASGPWVSHFLSRLTDQCNTEPLSTKQARLVKGSHIVVKSLFDHSYAYIFQVPDGRIVFAIPYEGEFTLIGTTDLNYTGEPATVAIDASEIAYLCDLVNRYFACPVVPADVLWTYSGVRPLVEDHSGKASEVTRDYEIELDQQSGAPVVSVFGGKITTYRKLAEEVGGTVAPLLGNRHGDWTGAACLPGGDLFGPAPDNRSVLEFEEFVARVQARYPWLVPALAARYAAAYGTRVDLLLHHCRTPDDLGEEILPALHAVEVNYLIREEWAGCAQDILWRRSKLGLHVPAGSEGVLDEWIARRGALKQASV